MTKVNMQEAKTRLSQLVVAAERGETVLLCRDGEPVAEIRALPPAGLDRLAIDVADLAVMIERDEAVAPLIPEDWGGWGA
jgi:antitoxin (DNA-binding transcriptional repressor) of toxin-antitoxin stability system